MARPIRKGLDYFPMDVNIFEDDKLQFISMRFEQKGELLTIKLLCKIYNNGYYINWDDDVAALFAKSAGGSVTLGFVNEVVYELLKRDFFDKDLYTQFAILTSRGIQKRYLRICKDACRVGYEIPPERVCRGLTTELSTQSKEEEKKGKEKKEEESKALPVPVWQEFFLYAEKNYNGDINVIKDHLEYKYKSWAQNNWSITRDGKTRPIKNWKTTLLNMLPHFKEKPPADSEDRIEGALRAGQEAINYFKNL